MNKVMNKNMNPEKEIGFFIGRTHRTMINVLHQRFNEKDIDITPEQGILLTKLGEEEGISQQELSNRIFREKSSVKRLIDSMERKNFLIRIEDKNDRRNKLIYLTNKGKVIKEKVIDIKIDFLEEINEKVEEDEMKICKKVLKQIFEAIQNYK